MHTHTCTPEYASLCTRFLISLVFLLQLSVTETVTEVCSRARHVWMWQLSLDTSTWFGLGELVPRGGNLAHALVLKPGVLAQGWIFLDKWASFSSSHKCSVWDSGSPAWLAVSPSSPEDIDQRTKYQCPDLGFVSLVTSSLLSPHWIKLSVFPGLYSLRRMRPEGSISYTAPSLFHGIQVSAMASWEGWRMGMAG